MSDDQQTQPESPESEAPPPAEAPSDVAESAQLSDSAGQPAPAAAGVAASDTVADPTASDQRAASSAEACTEAETEPAAATVDSEDDLANQIQALLDESKVKPAAAATGDAPPAAPTDEPTAAADAEPAPTDQAAATAASSATTAPAVAATDAAGQPPRQSKDVISVEQIDTMLAQQADDAVAGDFETVTEVLATAQAQPAEPEPAASDQLDQPTGAFDSPEQVIAQADAAADAPEFAGYYLGKKINVDEQCETPVGVTEPALASTAAAAPLGRRAGEGGRLPCLPVSLIRWQLVLAFSAETLRRICIVLDKPLATSPPQVRDLVGWAGLITLFNAAALLLAAMILL